MIRLQRLGVVGRVVRSPLFDPSILGRRLWADFCVRGGVFGGRVGCCVFACGVFGGRVGCCVFACGVFGGGQIGVSCFHDMLGELPLIAAVQC